MSERPHCDICDRVIEKDDLLVIVQVGQIIGEGARCMVDGFEACGQCIEMAPVAIRRLAAKHELSRKSKPARRARAA